MKNLKGVSAKYHGLGTKVKPKVGSLIRIVKNKENPVLLYNPFLLDNLSMDKVYEVYKILDTYKVRIRNDNDIAVDISKGFFQVVKTVSDKEIQDFSETQQVLESFDKVLKR